MFQLVNGLHQLLSLLIINKIPYAFKSIFNKSACWLVDLDSLVFPVRTFPALYFRYRYIILALFCTKKMFLYEKSLLFVLLKKYLGKVIKIYYLFSVTLNNTFRLLAVFLLDARKERYLIVDGRKVIFR